MDRRMRIFTPPNQYIHAKSLSVAAQKLANSAIAKNTQSLAIQRTSNLADRIALMPCTLLQAAHVLIHVAAGVKNQSPGDFSGGRTIAASAFNNGKDRKSDV